MQLGCDESERIRGEVSCGIDVSTMRQHTELVSHVAAELKSATICALGCDLRAGLEIVLVESHAHVRPLVRIVVFIRCNPGAE